MAFFYAVTATLPDEATAREYAAWLAGHVVEVIEAGAGSARIIRLDGGSGSPPRVETQYVFPGRDVFERYLATHAPRLRAEGLARFPPERGISMERRQGEIVRE